MAHVGRRSLEAGRALADIGTWLPLLLVQMRRLGVDSVPIALFIAVFMWWQGKFRLLKIVPVSVGVSVSLFLMFEVWFKVSLPKGPLEALLGY